MRAKPDFLRAISTNPARKRWARALAPLVAAGALLFLSGFVGTGFIGTSLVGAALRAEEPPSPDNAAAAEKKPPEQSVTFCYRTDILKADEARSAVVNYCAEQGRTAHFVEPQECDLQPTEGDRDWAIKRCMGAHLREPKFSEHPHVQPLPYAFLTVVCRLPGEGAPHPSAPQSPPAKTETPDK